MPIFFRLERWLEDVFPERLHNVVGFLAFPLFMVCVLIDLFEPSTEPRMPMEQEIWDAVAKRLLQIRPDYREDGPRTRPAALGWRFVQRLEIAKRKVPSPVCIEAGKYDNEILETVSDAKQADRHYSEEKDWGRESS